MEHTDRLSIKDARKLVQQLRSLRNPDNKEFEQIINSIRLDRAPIAPDASIETLLEALHDEELSIRAEAAQRLGTLGERVPVEPLLEALRDEQRYVRAEAARALGRLGERVPLEPLVCAMHDSDGSVRVAAVQSLGMFGERTSTSFLIVALRDPWPPVREAAIVAWGKLGARAPIEVVAAALQDEDKFVRIAALTVLGAAGERAPVEPILAALGDVQKSVREIAVGALGGMGQRVPIDILATAFNTSKWPPMREGIVRVLDMLGQQTPEKMLQAALHDEWPPVREAAELALQRRREYQREVLNRAPQLENVTYEGEDERSDAAVLDAASEEADPSRSGLLVLPYALAEIYRNVISKPFDQVTKSLRSTWDWLWSWPSTLLEQVQTRQIGKDNKIALIVACMLIGAWLLISRRPHASTPVADNAIQKPSLTANVDVPVIKVIKHPDLPSPIAT